MRSGSSGQDAAGMRPLSPACSSARHCVLCMPGGTKVPEGLLIDLVPPQTLQGGKSPILPSVAVVDAPVVAVDDEPLDEALGAFVPLEDPPVVVGALVPLEEPPVVVGAFVPFEDPPVVVGALVPLLLPPGPLNATPASAVPAPASQLFEVFPLFEPPTLGALVPFPFFDEPTLGAFVPFPFFDEPFGAFVPFAFFEDPVLGAFVDLVGDGDGAGLCVGASLIWLDKTN